ncbi:hypothetical protein LEP1GSC185_2176 [Leptospira licerasiae serovar Varillal str. VAR 010]|uniref:Uncharacterized protein n=1 Tax=Leptospira licerasiae str. MMD4847 TaxID=1049971 RepID=A0ABN0H4P7_9LEPT|nr:hypothetical protein LEP1GSC185_2176 [Leptospira licerasiae serovar Varillal str. VAR 010]EJZ40685.1 hypothetical protein LEP1GSC178_1447 [Leptospira licerasiae str. MMD4847]
MESIMIMGIPKATDFFLLKCSDRNDILILIIPQRNYLRKK